MTPQAILAVDPGLRSGWACWHGGAVIGGISDPMELCAEVDGWALVAREFDSAEVVCESYTITRGTAELSQQHWSLELIGAVRWICHFYGIKFVEPLQKPSEAKRFCPDARLRQLGLWTPGREDHERDARRHLVMRLAKHRLIDVRPL